ncbi:MAG: hypothetical protein P8M61_07245 [Crocinitomicaceae bacterium]|nr:hypothetical protein [Crocinitomicaceae bacterium]
MKFKFLLLLLLPLFLIGQDYPLLNAEERAYLYHIVKKSPILDQNFGRFFEYQGPGILHKNGEIHYDSIEEMIISNPETLLIRSEEIAKSPVGLIAEAANKMAIWELNKALLENQKKEEDQSLHLVQEYKEFEVYLFPKLPDNAFKEKTDKFVLNAKFDNVFNPSLSLDDKIAMLESLRYMDQQDILISLNALSYATNAYVEKRSFEIFKSLGGRADYYINVLVAAGDGSNTSGLLNEREKDEKGRWNKGLPKAVGLFPYHLSIKETENKKKKVESKIEPNRITTHVFQTAGNNRLTNIHFDVWGYNDKKQTTVVIEKSGESYRLFGSGSTRFLSPDSGFVGTGTFQSIIDDLEFNKMAELDEMIYGKKGFDYWIEYNTKKRDETELKIEKAEKSHSDLGYTPIKTSSKTSRKIKKDRRKSKTLKDYQPTTNSNQKQKKESQNSIVGLYGRFEAYKAKIVELEEQKLKAMNVMAKYQFKLDYYKQNFGRKPVPYTEEGGLYFFTDSTTFDIKTQEFVFKETADTTAFDVRLIAIPVSSLSNEADEVMLHINVAGATPNYDARLQLQLHDVFESDKFDLSDKLLQPKDSVAMQLFFEGLLDKKVDFSIVARGNGVGEWNGVKVKKTNPQEEEENYSSDKMDESYRRLRLSEVYINLGREIQLEINSFTDPVQSNLKLENSELANQMTSNNWSKNEMLSAMRTLTILRKLKNEVNTLAGQYLSRTDAKIVIDRFNKEVQKTKISVGTNSLKVKI